MVSVQRIVMVYLTGGNPDFIYGQSFRTTNCYGLSQEWNKYNEPSLSFPYNELLWFITTSFILQQSRPPFPYNELLWFIKLYLPAFYGKNTVSVQRIVMVYRVITSFTYLCLLCFRTTNCYGLSLFL